MAMPTEAIGAMHATGTSSLDMSVEVAKLNLTKGEIYLDRRTMGQAALQLEHGPRYFIAKGHLAATLLRPRSAPFATLG